MRVVVLGGTGFVGRAVARELAMAGHDPVVVHRGETEVEGDGIPHIHGSRAEVRNDLAGYRCHVPQMRSSMWLPIHARMLDGYCASSLADPC